MTAPVIANPTTPVGIVLIDPATGLPYSASGGGGAAISAGTNISSSGTVVFSNSNGVTFGMSPTGVITATVTPGAAAGIAAFQVSNTTYTSGTVNFINSNGVSFGSTTGGGVTASYTVPGATVFSNSNNVSFGLAGSTITATATVPTGLSAVAAGTQTQTSGTLVFANSNGLTFGMSNSSQVTGSYTVPGATVFSNSNNVSFGLAGSTVTATATFAGGGASAGVSTGGNTSGNTGTYTGQLVLAGGNNITLSVSSGAAGAQTITISGANIGGAQTGISGVIVSDTTYTSGTISFSNANGISFGSSAGQAITASYTVPTQSNQTIGIYASSQTTAQSSSSTVDARSLTVVGQGIISAGLSGGSLIISAPNTTALTQLSAGISTVGNTVGTTGLASAQLVLAGGSNITLSGSTSSGSMTVTISGVNPSVNFSAGTTSNNLGTVVFSNSNGVSFGLNGSTITGSVAAQTNQTAGLYALGNTTQNSSTTLDARTLSFNGLGAMTVGYSNGNIQMSAPALSAGVSTGGNTSGNTGTYSGQVVFAGGNNITLSVSSAAGGAQTITISGANAGGAQTGISGVQVSNATYTSGTITFQNANGISFGSSGANGISASYTVPTQTNQTVGLYGLGNTTQNSSTTLDARTISFNGLGAMTVGFSNGSVQLSAPVTSSISGTGQVSISVNGSTISIGVPNYGTLSYWDNAVVQDVATSTTFGAGSVVLQPAMMNANLSISALREFISGSFSSSSNSSYAVTLSVQAGLYTLNGSSLSLATSGSQSYAFTNTSSNSFSVLTGIKGITVPLAASITPGNYWIGLWSNSASANANWATLNNVVFSAGAITYNGILGSATNATNQPALGGGMWSTTSASLPSSIGLSHITGSAGNTVALVNLYNVSA